MLHDALFPHLSDLRWMKLDLNLMAKADSSISTTPDNRLLDPEQCYEWVRSIHRANLIDHSYGGYMEDRAALWRGHYHKPEQMTHVGVDYNVPAGMHIRLPVPGRLVFVEEDPDQNGGWGTRMIFKCGSFFVTFAHLWLAYGSVGTDYPANHCFGEVGNSKFNGGWYPHLHVQVQRKYNPYADGYQRYTKELEDEFPDPEFVLTKPSFPL